MTYIYGLSNLERFWKYVDKSKGEDACWLWKASCKKPSGYGQIKINGNMVLAHRWILGEIRGLPLRWDTKLRENANHTCDNPPCVNPKHLYVGNQKANVSDAIKRGRWFESNKTHCKNGHVLVESNIYRPPKNPKQRHCRTCRYIRDSVARDYVF